MSEQISNFATQRIEEVSGRIKEAVRVAQEKAESIKQRLYSPSNERPLFEIALKSMVCVPMSWWSAFICGYDFPSLATSLPPELRPTRDSLNPNAAGPPALTASLESSKVSEREIVDYSDVLCVHFRIEETQDHWKPEGEAMEEEDDNYRETGSSTFSPINKRYGKPFGVDPLAVWDGKVKFVPKNVITDIFRTYNLTPSIPDISLSSVVCGRCANSFSQLMEYLYDQWATLSDICRFTKAFDSPSTLLPQRKSPSSSSPSVVPEPSSTVEIEVLSWVSRRAISDAEARFSVRERSKKTPEGSYDVYCAAEDGRKEINKLRDIGRPSPRNKKQEKSPQIDVDSSHFFPATASSPESLDGYGGRSAHSIDFSDGVVCPHGWLVPGRKASCRALVSIEEFLVY